MPKKKFWEICAPTKETYPSGGAHNNHSKLDPYDFSPYRKTFAP